MLIFFLSKVSSCQKQRPVRLKLQMAKFIHRRVVYRAGDCGVPAHKDCQTPIVDDFIDAFKSIRIVEGEVTTLLGNHGRVQIIRFDVWPQRAKYERFYALYSDELWTALHECGVRHDVFHSRDASMLDEIRLLRSPVDVVDRQSWFTFLKTVVDVELDRINE